MKKDVSSEGGRWHFIAKVSPVLPRLLLFFSSSSYPLPPLPPFIQLLDDVYIWSRPQECLMANKGGGRNCDQCRNQPMEAVDKKQRQEIYVLMSAHCGHLDIHATS